MRSAFIVAALAAALVGASQANEPSPAQKAQQLRMSQCNLDAAGKTGDVRKSFMKDCLSAKKASQQDKMKTCNAEAAGKVGDERKAFMSHCLRARPAS